MIVYIAGPYSKGDTAENVKKAVDCADRLCAMGYIPFIPHLTHLWHLISPKPTYFWQDYDLVWLDVCDALLRLPGDSEGADREVSYAIQHCIPVYYSLEELNNEV